MMINQVKMEIMAKTIKMLSKTKLVARVIMKEAEWMTLRVN
jgi:hypothetical protein